MKFVIDDGNGDAWASYEHKRRFWQRSMIILHKLERGSLDTEYAKTIFGMDHEYLHHVLYELEGLEACKGLDRIIGSPSDLVNHCIWTGFRGFQIMKNGVEIYNTI